MSRNLCGSHTRFLLPAYQVQFSTKHVQVIKKGKTNETERERLKIRIRYGCDRDIEIIRPQI
jgi:hypothetical protein